MRLNVYLANKMSGIPYFNAPWFDEAEGRLLALGSVGQVFNPAQHDRDAGFDPMKCPGGSQEEALAAGFNLRKALGADWAWIAANSDCLVVGPQWEDSPGTISEIACHQALRLPVWEFEVFLAMHEHPYLRQLVLRPIMELGDCRCDRTDWGA